MLGMWFKDGSLVTGGQTQSCAERLFGKSRMGSAAATGDDRLSWASLLSGRTKRRTELKWPSYSPVSPIGFFWGVEGGGSAAWFKYRFLLWHVDGRLRVLCQQHKSMDALRLVPTLRVLKMFFVAQIRPSSSSTPPCTAHHHGPCNSNCTSRNRTEIFMTMESEGMLPRLFLH